MPERFTVGRLRQLLAACEDDDDIGLVSASGVGMSLDGMLSIERKVVPPGGVRMLDGSEHHWPAWHIALLTLLHPLPAGMR